MCPRIRYTRTWVGDPIWPTGLCHGLVIVSNVIFSSPPFEAVLHSWKHSLGLRVFPCLPKLQNPDTSLLPWHIYPPGQAREQFRPPPHIRNESFDWRLCLHKETKLPIASKSGPKGCRPESSLHRDTMKSGNAHNWDCIVSVVIRWSCMTQMEYSSYGIIGL